MKSSEITTGVEYGIVPSWSYSSREARDPLKTTRSRVTRAKIVSMDKYEYEVWRAASEDDPNFRKAREGERRFGYKVTDGNIFWVARPQDIVAVWATLEARWNIEESLEAQRRAEQEKAEEKERERRREIDAYTERLRSTLPALVQQITGKPYGLLFNNAYYKSINGINPEVTVTMDARLLERLVERVFEAQGA